MISNVRERQYGGYAWDGGFYAGAWIAKPVPWREPGQPRTLHLLPGEVSVMLSPKGGVTQLLSSCPCGCGKLLTLRQNDPISPMLLGEQRQITLFKSTVGCTFCFRFEQGLLVRT